MSDKTRIVMTISGIVSLDSIQEKFNQFMAALQQKLDQLFGDIEGDHPPMTVTTYDVEKGVSGRDDEYLPSCRSCGKPILKISHQWHHVSGDKDHRAAPKIIHGWFELTYAQYLTIPRSVLQSMPERWQEDFVALLSELDATIDWRPKQGQYRVSLHDIAEEWDEDEGRHVETWGPELEDPLMDYQRGRRRIPHKEDTGG